MRNYYNHSKLFLLLGALAIALLIQGVIHLYREVETFGAEHRYTTSHVTYGTQSKATAMPPMVQSPSLRRTAVAVPITSGSAVPTTTLHSTPHTLHTSPSSFTIHTTSSAEVRSVGSGAGGCGIATTNGSTSSRRGITYGGASVSMPTLALATPSFTTTPSAEGHKSISGPRRIHSDGTGEYEGEPSTDGNQYWDGEDWVDYAEGATKIENGIAYVYKGGEWVKINDQADPYVPVGPMPWLFMAVLAAGYIYWKRRSSLALLSVFSR